jgi:hypothetical protein
MISSSSSRLRQNKWKRKSKLVASSHQHSTSETTWNAHKPIRLAMNSLSMNTSYEYA